MEEFGKVQKSPEAEAEKKKTICVCILVSSVITSGANPQGT